MSADEFGFGDNTLPVGQNVELHPGLDRWMMGDRRGRVVGYATSNGGVSSKIANARVRGDGAIVYAVKLDVSGKRVKIAATNIKAQEGRRW